jgi:hypothetical protein
VAADPPVNRALGRPDRLVVANMSAASRAPTVIPAARPAPLNTCEAITTARVRRCSVRCASGVPMALVDVIF